MSQSLGRGLSILIELGDGPHNLDELAAKLGVHKTTVLRLLRTLEAERFVRRDEHHRFHLGTRLAALAALADAPGRPGARDVRAVAAPHLARLNEATGGAARLVTGPPALLDDLARAGASGRYAAAPVRDAAGGVVAAVTVPDGGDLTGLLATADAISADYGRRAAAGPPG
ncbi:helix-turn-helix domain-containing protein [Actinomadura nitritigenes]|uniref:Helix-turn-helix domain-containing protein n=2 Tax=Actinomadura nitritigenes TaxID=134602 RepID=A0ABS3RBF5_9ACTN|nr:helix-turn-helix domain-containing protein [Actinomadura nitritigenes]MBO2442943.1 helix-turn-helix domain-containing protein [Actinomadura nitritigenes]